MTPVVSLPRFYPKQGSSTHSNLMGIVKAIWEPFACRARPSVSVKKIANGDIWFFTERDWSQECCHGNNRCHSIPFVMYVSGAKYEEHTALIFLELFLIECSTVLVEPLMTSSLSSFAQYKNVNISKKKNESPKRNTPFFFTLKSLSNKQQLFFLFHRYFNFVSIFEPCKEQAINSNISVTKYSFQKYFRL